jgi:hypothetical protein
MVGHVKIFPALPIDKLNILPVFCNEIQNQLPMCHSAKANVAPACPDYVSDWQG